MKKNISINLFGTLYNIDEDAYTLLENYLQSMQRYFSRQEGGEEIADDIEHRVAELLWQRREAGMEAVNIEVVKEIIATIGNAEEIGEGDEQAENHAESTDTTGERATTGETFEESFSHFAKETGRFARDTYDKGRRHVNTHRFYRRTDDKVLGGVCSGLTFYFDGNDVLLWRLGTVVATILLGCIGVGIVIPVIYILLWALAPVANTPEDRLRMQGKDITPENLTQQVMDESQPSIAQQDHRELAGGCMKAMFIVLGLFLLIPLAAAFIALTGTFVTVLGLTTGLLGAAFSDMSFMHAFSSFVAGTQPFFIMALVCGLLLIAIPIYSVIRLIRRSSKKLSAGVVIALIIGWFLTLGLGIAATVGTCIKGDEWKDGERYAYRIAKSEREMKSQGWRMESQNNLYCNFTEERTGFCDLPHYGFCFNTKEADSINYSVRFAKDVTLEEGQHHFVSLTEGGQEGLTYTLRYKDNGETKNATIHTSSGGVHLKGVSFAEVGQYAPMFHNPDSTGWEEFAHYVEDWVLHQVEIPHADAGTCTIVIDAANCTIPARIREVKVE